MKRLMAAFLGVLDVHRHFWKSPTPTAAGGSRASLDWTKQPWRWCCARYGVLRLTFTPSSPSGLPGWREDNGWSSVQQYRVATLGHGEFWFDLAA